MLDLRLPKYVRRAIKPSGRHVFYYERFRGTGRAWPRVRLPDGPHDGDFWKRYKQCERLIAERDGGWTWSYVDEQGGRHALPCLQDVGHEAFWIAVDKAEAAGNASVGKQNKTFRALIAEYKDHTAYTKLAEKTRQDYDRHLAVILGAWADDPVATMTAVDAQAAIDTFQDTPAAGRVFRAVLSKLVAFGVPRGYRLDNPVTLTEKIEHDPATYKPWTDWMFELFFEHVRPALHLPVYSALYTGQRSIDVLPMLRPKPDAEAVELVARKTKAQVWAPIHFEYRAILAAAHVDCSQLHVREDGKPWTLEGFRTAWQRELTFTVEDEDEVTPELRAKEKAMKRLREAGLVFHGLRKNAVNMLLEVGCTEAEVGALVEMSEDMVRHYSKEVDKRRLATNAMKKLEAEWSRTRKKLFGDASHRSVQA